MRHLCLLQMFGVAGLYFVTAWLGFALAIPPGNVTALWPPSGIAVAAFLLCGWRAAPGVALGSFLVNLVFLRKLLPACLASEIAAGIALGSTLQTLTGGLLIRRFIGEDPWPVRTGSVFKFIGCVGGCCVAAATVGVTSLHLGGVITSARYPFSWLTWWIGDSAGVLLFTPGILFAARKLGGERIPRDVTFPATGLAAGLSLVTFCIMLNQMLDHRVVQFQREATAVISVVKHHIEESANDVGSVTALYGASTDVTRSQFRDFARIVSPHNRSLEGLGFLPRVPASQRSAYEEAARRGGMKSFQIHSDDCSGHPSAAPRDEHYPIHFVEPLDNNEDLLGRDMAALESPLNALTLARDSGLPATAGPVALRRSKADQHSLLLFWPVYRNHARLDSSEARREHLTGFVFGMIDPRRLITEALVDVEQGEIDFYLFEQSEPGKSELWYLLPSGGGRALASPAGMTQADLQADLHISVALDFAGRAWRVIGKPAPAYSRMAFTWPPWAVLISGLLLSVMLLLHMSARREAEEALQEERLQLSRRVEERTAALVRANAELSQAGRAKDEFLATMSHELRTPLNAVLGLSEALVEGIYGPLPPRQIDALRTISQSGRHLLSLINSILDVTKLEAGTMKLALEAVEVGPLCRGSLGVITPEARKKKLEVELVVEDAACVVRAEERRLKQILINLLSNAVKFTPEGGRIGLEVSRDEARGVVHLVVSDTGIGIHSDQLQKLFRPFVQVDSSLSRKYGGTGLGLFLVHRLAKMHGGSVSVESTPGKGSRFRVTLPSGQASGGPGPAQTAGAPRVASATGESSAAAPPAQPADSGDLK
jgi:two-component system, sensor histidine kinase